MIDNVLVYTLFTMLNLSVMLSDMRVSQAANSNYGWDSTRSIFTTHHPGVYFFTFSLKADADAGDNFKYE